MVRSTTWGFGAVILLACAVSCASLLPPTSNNTQNNVTGAERWECYAYFGSRTLGTLIANRHDTSGTVDFDGVVASTQFTIQGIERRWDWGLGTNGRFNYAIVISTDGTGKFYNFRGSNDGTAKPRSDVFKCARR